MTVITMPSSPTVDAVEPFELDFGLLQRPATGAAATRIDRPGLRLGGRFSFPPMPAATARAIVSRLSRAKSAGLRIKWPLMGVSQGAPGSTLVDGNSNAGTSLAVRGGAPGYQALEGYWLNVVDAAGVYYLHHVRADATFDGAGEATLSIWPPLRAELVDGNSVILDVPMIEGLVTEYTPPARLVSKIVQPTFTLSEEN